MSFITCCPSCGTKFRVVTDQLRISDGWVRCGRCQEVFDANAALQAPPPPTEAEPVDATRAPEAAAVARSAEAASEVNFSPAAQEEAAGPEVPVVEPSVHTAETEHDGIPQAAASGYELPVPPEHEEDWDAELVESPWNGARPQQASSSVSATIPEDAWLDEVPAAQDHVQAVSQHEPAMDMAGDAQPQEALLQQDADPGSAQVMPRDWEPQAALQTEEAQAGMWAEVVRFIHPPKPEALPHGAALASDEEIASLPGTEVAAEPAAPGVPLSETEAVVPGFVKQAQRRAWWSKPSVRFVMGMLLMLLPVALLLQIVVHERNRLMAWQPAWRSHLEAMCVALRCEVAPYKDISAVVLTGSAFVQDAQPYHYKLDLSIQNQAALAVATPALELTLTDAHDQVLVRKVFQPAELGAPAELAARSEWNTTLPVRTQGLNLPVSGYRVMAFYP